MGQEPLNGTSDNGANIIHIGSTGKVAFLDCGSVIKYPPYAYQSTCDAIKIFAED